MSDQELASIDATAFNSFDNLAELRLDNNELYTLRAYTFLKLSKLKSLYLNNNQLTLPTKSDNEPLGHDDPSLIFKGLDNLLNLFMQYNQIDQLDPKLFGSNLNKLQVLYLNHNQLTSIKAKTFDNLISLKKLRLDHNKLASIDSSFDILNKLSLLERVNMQENPLCFTKPDLVKSLCTSSHNPTCTVITTSFRKTTPIITSTLATTVATTKIPTTLLPFGYF